MTDVGSKAAAEAVAPPGPSSDGAFLHWNALLEALPVGVYVCDRDGRVTHHNRKAAELWGRVPPPGALYCGSHRLLTADGVVLRPVDCPMGEVLRTGEARRDCEMVVERPDGRRLDVLVNVEPLRGADGALVGAVNCFQEITEVKRAQTRAGLVDNWVRDVVQRSPVAIYWTDQKGRILAFNPAAAALWGRAPVLGEDLWCGSHRLFHPDGRSMPLDQCPTAMALKTGEATVGQEAVYERPDGSRGAFLAYPTLLHGERGVVMGAVNMLVDISERKQAEDRQRVLIDELNHRVKNTLASVQSLAAQSLRGEGDPKRMRERFESRLVALANAHNQLARRSWQDADLRALAEDVLAPYRADDRLELQGEAVTIRARSAVTFSLVLHELATNAVKYGALSVPAGRVAVTWRRDGSQRLVVEWREAGGPPVTTPRRQGFGTRFIAGAVTRDLGGRLEHEFEPPGVRCRIEAPL